MKTSSVDHRNGLTLIGVIVPLAALTIVVAVTLIVVRRNQERQWRQWAISEPNRVFTIRCEPEKDHFAADEPVIIHCTITNHTAIPLDLYGNMFVHVTDKVDTPKGVRQMLGVCSPHFIDDVKEPDYVLARLGSGESFRVTLEGALRGPFRGTVRLQTYTADDSTLYAGLEPSILTSPSFSYTADKIEKGDPVP